LIVFGNSKPGMRQVDEGIRRRLHLIEYKGKIDKPDITFKDRLVAEYPAILHRLIQGCLAWQARGGLCKPASIDDNVQAYFEAEDSLGAWLTECVVQDPSCRTATAEAYKSFADWVGARGEHAPRSKLFTTFLKSRGWETYKSGTMFFKAMRLKQYMPEAHADWHSRD
jgi:putative DNA primase/helicase